jgi:hypothetical protein
MCITIGILGLVWVIEGPRKKEDGAAETSDAETGAAA